MLKLTDRCNLSCSYCYMKKKNTTDINSQTAISIIHNIEMLSKINCGKPLNVFISGGEVTLLPIEILNIFFSAFRTIPNVHISMNTNGTLFTQCHAELCKKYNIDISLSLDGHADLHDNHRSNSFDAVMTTLFYLNLEKIKYGLITVVDEKSFEQKEELYNFFKTHSLNTKMNNANGYSSSEKYTDFLIWLYNKLKEDGYPFQEYTILDIQKTLEGKSSHCDGCAWGNCYRDFLAIDYNGNVSVCERFFGFSNRDKQKYVIGNVNDSNIIDLIHTEKHTQLQKALATRKIECMDCDYYKYCGGGCSYDLIVSGDKTMCNSRKRLFSNLIGG